MIILVLVLLGLCFASFVNALVWRVWQQSRVRGHERDRRKALKAADNKVGTKEFSILFGRSMCPNCKHMLAWHDLIPVISWLSLQGKCRYCHKPISWQYPLVELATAFLFVLSYKFFPQLPTTNHQLPFVFWLIFLVGFMALVIYDLRWMLLPDRIVRPLQGLAVIYVLLQAIIYHGGWISVQGAGLGVICSAGLFYGLYQISHGKWIGGGDVKLAVILGLLLGGPAKVLLMIFIASSMGTILVLPLLVLGKVSKNSRIPFGPFLILATIIVYLFGTSLLAWYTRQFLFA